MFDFEKTIFFPEECFNFVVSSKTFKINSILNTVHYMCLIITSVQLLHNSRGMKQKLKLPIFGKTDKIARTEKKTQSRLISLLLILSKH